MSKVIYSSAGTFQKDVIESPIPVLVDLYADWCGPCRAIAPLLNKLAGEFADRIKIVKIDVDAEKELAAKISELPEPAQVAKAGGEEGDYGLAGLAVQDLDRDTAQELGLKGKVQGVVVTGVEPDSGADRAGLMPGDVIREINRKPVKSVQDYEKAASSLKKGENVLMLINRRGASLFLSAKV